jgi:hypothetical protein
VQDINVPFVAEEASDPSLQAAVMESDDASGRIEAFALLQRVLLNAVSQGEQRREGVCELHETDCGCDTCKSEEIRDRGSEDEGNSPVEGNEACPEDLAAFGNESWSTEPFHQDVVVDDFDANVAVETGGDQSGDHCEDVSESLPAVGRDTLVGDLGRVSACILRRNQAIASDSPGRYIVPAKSNSSNHRSYSKHK